MSSRESLHLEIVWYFLSQVCHSRNNLSALQSLQRHYPPSRLILTSASTSAWNDSHGTPEPEKMTGRPDQAGFRISSKAL